MTSFFKKIFSSLNFWSGSSEDKDSSSDSDSISDSDDDCSIRKDLYFNKDWNETDSTAPPPYSSEASFYMGNKSPPRYPSRRRISPVKYPNSLSREFAKEALALGFPITADCSSDEDESFYQHGRRYGSNESYKQNSAKNTKNKKLFGSPKENSSKHKASPARPRKKTKVTPPSPHHEKVYMPDNLIELFKDTLIRYDDRREVISDDVFADVERHIYHSTYVNPKNRFKRGREYCIDTKRQAWDVKPCNYDEPNLASNNESHTCVYSG